jgi:hypothetical protein
MHTVDLLEHALVVAGRLGYRVRNEWLGGSGGGGCLLRGQKWIFLDLARSPWEQFVDVIDAIRGDPALIECEIPPGLAPYLPKRHSA